MMSFLLACAHYILSSSLERLLTLHFDYYYYLPTKYCCREEGERKKIEEKDI